MLVVDNVRFAHAGQSRPYRFSMRAEPGVVTAVRGTSGSGKSTLLDLVTGFLQPESGSITLDGRDLLRLPAEARPVSILFQSDTLFEHLSAAHNVSLALPSSTLKAERDRTVASALAEVGLPDVAHQRADTLSGGQKQRVALARTLIRNRPILLLDEPFSALDDETRGATRELVRSLTERHQWITLLVTHHADDIAAIASATYRISDGALMPEAESATIQ